MSCCSLSSPAPRSGSGTRRKPSRRAGLEQCWSIGSSRSCISDREKRLRILKRCFHRFSLISGEVVRDPYNFDFFTLRKQAAERELEEWLLAHIRKFLIEPGAGFAFVGQQVHLEVAGGIFISICCFTISSCAVTLPSILRRRHSNQSTRAK
jgi:predicted nuclease of restriction endonuclease-like (RecB) superfamily